MTAIRGIAARAAGIAGGLLPMCGVHAADPVFRDRRRELSADHCLHSHKRRLDPNGRRGGAPILALTWAPQVPLYFRLESSDVHTWVLGFRQFVFGSYRKCVDVDTSRRP